MKVNEQQEMLTNELTNFLKTFKQALSAKIHIFYSILTKADTMNLIDKVKAKQNQYAHSVPEAIQISDDTAKIIERFCMRISEFLEYRICVLKSLKQQWLSTEINCFQGSLKKIFNQAKTFGRLDVLIKKIIDCKNIFAKNVLTQIIKNKCIQGQQALQVKRLFQQKLLKSITLISNQNYGALQYQFGSRNLWTSQRQNNNPFQDCRPAQKQGLINNTQNSTSAFLKPNTVARIVSSIVQGQKVSTRNRPSGIKLSSLRGAPNVLSQASLTQGYGIRQPSLNKKNSNQESSPKLPSLKQNKQQQKKQIKAKKANMTKQQYFDNIKKAMALEDTYWIVNSTYASLIKELKQLNRKNEATIVKFNAKFRKNTNRDKVQSLIIPETTVSKFSFRQKQASPIVSKGSSRKIMLNTRNNLNLSIHNPFKIPTNLLKPKTARDQFSGFNHRIKTISSNQTRLQEVQMPKIELSIPDNFTINQIQKRLYSVIN